VDHVFSNEKAFAALLARGRVVVWGDAASGGDCSVGATPADSEAGPDVCSQLDRGVHTVYSTDRAFAAKLRSGEVVAWGDPNYGGDASLVQDQLVDITEVYSTTRAFAAIRSDGKVVTWGDPNHGGVMPDADRVRLVEQGNASSVHATE
jgi:hypothetical protein